MSSTNKTTNYELSQFVGTDIPSILGDYNGDMRKIDSAIKDASVAGGENAVAIAELQASTARMNTEIGGINSTVNTLGGKVVGIESNVNDLDDTVNDIDSAVQGINDIIPASASSSNKLATMADIGQTTVPDTVMFSDAVVSTAFNLSDYADMGHMFKAVYDYIKQIYTTDNVNLSVILRVAIGNDVFTMYPVDSSVLSQSPTFSFSGHSTNLGGATSVIYGFMELFNSDNSGYFLERFLTFANSYWGTDSTFADGTVTGHEIKHTADETTTAPSNITVCKMIDKVIA